MNKLKQYEFRMTIDHSSPIPLHVQVETLLRDLIKLPEFANGTFLPKEVNLAKELGISRNTVRQAINKLVLEGLIERKKGIGSKVVNNPVNTKLDSWKSFTQEMNEQGIPFTNYEIKSEWIETDDELAQILQISEGVKVLKMERLRGLKDGPFVHFISYFHPRIGLTGDEDFSLPLYELLEKDYSTIAKTSKEKISAIKADQSISQKLSVSVNEPILFRERFVLDPGQRIIEYNLGYYRADKFSYSIEIKR